MVGSVNCSYTQSVTKFNLEKENNLSTTISKYFTVLLNTLLHYTIILMFIIIAQTIDQGFQSGPVPGTFTRLRSCIVPAEITEPPQN